MTNDEEQPNPNWRMKIDQLNTWRTELTKEAVLLPQTLAELRATIADLRQVSKRLERATEGIELLLDQAESTGVAPMARQLNAAATEMQQQLRDLQSQVPGSEIVGQAVDEVQRTLTALTGLIPKPKPR